MPNAVISRPATHTHTHIFTYASSISSAFWSCWVPPPLIVSSWSPTSIRPLKPSTAGWTAQVPVLSILLLSLIVFRESWDTSTPCSSLLKRKSILFPGLTGFFKRLKASLPNKNVRLTSMQFSRAFRLFTSIISYCSRSQLTLADQPGPAQEVTSEVWTTAKSWSGQQGKNN